MTNTPKSQTAPVVMDARKFVRQINNSAAAKLKFFENAVSRMGSSVGKEFRLASLDSNNVIYEDVDQNTFYIADIKKSNRGKVQLENIRPIQIVEEDKASQYKKNIRDLVDNICEGKLTQADKIFNKIESQRFRSKVIPESGWITLKDGIARHIPVATRIVQEDHAHNITKLFTEAVRDTVEVKHGRVVRGTISDGHEKFVIPINEFTRRRLIAHKMRNAAFDAYKSPAFQNLVMECSALVCEGKISAAVKVAAKFLKEEQEFCLLNFNDTKTLVENTLATRIQFNTMLANDVASLLYKTNMKVNRDTILESWAKMAQKSEHSGLLTNVNILSESSDFESDYQKFLNIIFNEEADIQQTRARAYRQALRVIAAVLPDLEDEEGNDVSSSLDELNDLISRLSGAEPDTDAILQAEELLAGISDSLVDSVQDLESFDSMPGEEENIEDEEQGDVQALSEIPGPKDEDELGDEMSAPLTGSEEEEEEEGGMPPMPPMEGRLVPVEQMDIGVLLEELEDWRVHGDGFLREYGYDQCYNDMERYIKRCIEIGPKANVIRESFESMRGRLVNTGSALLEDVSDDPYGESVISALNGSDALLENNDPKDPERDPSFWGSLNTTFEDRIDLDYRHTFFEGEQPYEMSGGLNDAGGLRMDDLRGKSGGVKTIKSDGCSFGGSAAGYHAPQRGTGVAKKGAKPVDGINGEHSTSGAAGGSTRMDDYQGGGGVQKQDVMSTDGCKGHSTSAQRSESTVKAFGGNPSTDLSMGSDYQSKGGVLPKKLHKGDGAKGDGASPAKRYTIPGGLTVNGHDMGEFQGRGGVADDNLHTDQYKGQGKVKSDGGLRKASRHGDMSHQQGSGGVAEAITPERIAALISEMDNEDEMGEVCKTCKCDPCECEMVSEEAKNGNKTSCTDCKCDPCECGDVSKGYGSNGDLGSGLNLNDDGSATKESQYKGASRKYHTSGRKKAKLSAESKEAFDALSEGRVAAFVGTPDSVAAAVDQALGSLDDDLDNRDDDLGGDLGDLGDDLGGDLEGTDDLEGDLEGADDLGDDLGAPENDGGEDLEDALDEALGGDDEDDDDDDEVVGEGVS